MSDMVLIISLSTSFVALATAVLTHIRYSSCFGGNCRTRSNVASVPITPQDSLTTPLLQSQPINIPARPVEKKVYI